MVSELVLMVVIVGIVLAIVLPLTLIKSGTSGGVGTLSFLGTPENIGNPNQVSYWSNVDGTNLQPSKNSFTFECFLKLNPVVIGSQNNASHVFALSGQDSSTMQGRQLLGISIEGSESARTLYVWWTDDAGSLNQFNQDNYPVDNAFHHLALVGNGNDVLTVYLDGEQFAQITSISYQIDTSNVNLIAPHFNLATYPEDNDLWRGSMIGFLSNVRFNTTTALYTSNFTVPTAPLTNVDGTALLVTSQTLETAYADSSNNIYPYNLFNCQQPNQPRWVLQPLV